MWASHTGASRNWMYAYTNISILSLFCFHLSLEAFEVCKYDYFHSQISLKPVSSTSEEVEKHFLLCWAVCWAVQYLIKKQASLGFGNQIFLPSFFSFGSFLQKAFSEYNQYIRYEWHLKNFCSWRKYHTAVKWSHCCKIGTWFPGTWDIWFQFILQVNYPLSYNPANVLSLRNRVCCGG